MNCQRHLLSQKSPGHWTGATTKLRSLIAAYTVEDVGQDIGGGGDAPAVAVSAGVGGEIVLRAGLVLVAGDYETGGEV